MKIQSMFQKDIDRDINGVVQVSQDDQRSLKQELDEYIITNGKHAIDYFANKFDDPMMYADAVRSSSMPTETILFDILKQAPVNKDETAILRVFAKMFYLKF